MKYVFANWKMYLDLKESVELAKGLKDLKIENAEVNIFVSSLAFTSVLDQFKDSKITVGAENVYWEPKGAFTGEVSVQMYKDAGAGYALVGHSERRHVFGEIDEDVGKKIEACFKAGLKVLFCIGEKEEERSGGETVDLLKKQLSVLSGLDIPKGGLMIAYEPVWAIGTGNACSPEDATQASVLIKEEVAEYTDLEIPILYGGSVNLENVLSYIGLEEFAGVFVGGASTKLAEFSKILEQVK